MNAFEYEEEVRTMRQGRRIIIPPQRENWWRMRIRNGFFYLMEESEEAVTVVGHSGEVYYFNTGLDKKKINVLMREMFPKQIAVAA